ncbi:MAG: DNA adenine methylase [Scardovia wiggsiae]
MDTSKPLHPILKWAGGKRQLLDEIIPMTPPSEYRTYVEPFIGGGALLLQLQPEHAVINDSNQELINVYECVRDRTEELLNILRGHAAKNSADYFYKIRALDRNPEYANLTPAARAARIIYLNRTCFNGLYRVNSAGQFNSPYGRYKNPVIVDEPGIKALAEYLRKDIVLVYGDYAEVLRKLDNKAFVYLDPPYMPISNSSSFTGYTTTGFDYAQQIRLRDECNNLVSRGIHFLESNSDCAEIRELYKGYTIKSVKARRNVNAKGDKRGEISEVLIYG